MIVSQVLRNRESAVQSRDRDGGCRPDDGAVSRRRAAGGSRRPDVIGCRLVGVQ